MKGSIFDIDHSKYRVDGLKGPLKNYVDKVAVYPCVDASAKLANRVLSESSLEYWAPNIFTACSFVSRVVSLYNLVNDRFEIAAGTFLLGYMFDCLDGYYARKYDKCTTFGCYFDHTNDLLTSLLFFVVVLKKGMYITATLLLLMGVFAVNQAVYDESLYNNYTPFFELLCRSTSGLHVLDESFISLFGTSTWAMLVGVSIWLEPKL